MSMPWRWCHLPLLFFSCEFATYGVLMFHNWLLTHKCLLTHLHITDNFISHMRQRPIRFCIIYCQFCHTPIIALSKYSYIHNFPDKPLSTRISENIHKVRWEKSRYANFPSITPPQVLCIPRGGGWDLHSSYIPYRICIVLYFHTSLQVLCRLVGVGGHLCGKHSSYF